MKTLKIFLILISLFVFLNADDDKHEHKYKNLEYLNLNSIQIKQMKEILIESKHKYNDFYKEKRSTEKKLENIMRNDVFDKDKYINLLENLNKNSANLEAEKMEKIHKILNPIQRKKFAKYLEEWEID